MQIEKYFSKAIEFEQLLHQLYPARGTILGEDEKKKLLQSPYIQDIKSNQSLNGGKMELPLFSVATVNKLKKDFFFNISITSFQDNEGDTQDQMVYHSHNYLELIYVVEGSYHQTINGTHYEHKKGDTCLMNPNVHHRDWVSSAGNRALFICLGQNYVSKELFQVLQSHKELVRFMEYQLGKKSVQYIVFPPFKEEETDELLEQILIENLEKQPGYHTVIKGLLVRLFYKLVAGGNYKECRQSKKEIEENLMAEITRYMESHLADGTRANTANYFHFNPDYLNRMLVGAMGKTYSEYMRELRLREAAQRLTQTHQSVNDIIRELGFSNKGYFNRIFIEQYGMLPGAYRKQA